MKHSIWLNCLVTLGLSGITTPTFSQEIKEVSSYVNSTVEQLRKNKSSTVKLDDKMIAAAFKHRGDEVSFDQLGELIVLANRPDLIKNFVSYKIADLGSANEGPSWGLKSQFERCQCPYGNWFYQSLQCGRWHACLGGCWSSFEMNPRVFA